MGEKNSVLPRTCFSCETPIKFAFFCSDSFVRGKNSKSFINADTDGEITSICLIDSNALRVYCSNGEDFLTNLAFPVSRVWPTRFGILLEKEASNTIIQSHSISMPRIFSLSHPLDEICPVLNRSNIGVISYLIEAEYSVVFTADNTNLVLLYDNKLGKHFVSRLRKATEEEINFVGSQNDTATATGLSGTSQHHHSSASPAATHRPVGQGSFSQSFLKFTGGKRQFSTIFK